MLVIESWGKNAVRVRAAQNHAFRGEETFSALFSRSEEMKKQESRDIHVQTDGRSAVLVNGKIRCELMVTRKEKFFNQRGELLLEEYDRNRFRENAEGNLTALRRLAAYLRSHQRNGQLQAHSAV